MAAVLPAALVCHLGTVDYQDSWKKMQDYTDQRDSDSADQIWFLQHPPVYTLGKNGKPEHLINPGNIPVINADRGGQVTYHGPGQIIVYTLLDLKRLNIGIRQLVTILEQAVIELLAGYGLQAEARAEAPGVYVNSAKIAALGLRVRKGRSFHGLALNVDMDLQPFSGINPCGYEGLKVTRLKDHVADIELVDVVEDLQQILLKNLGQASQIGQARHK